MAGSDSINNYDRSKTYNDKQIAEGRHRRAVGGLWDEMGAKQRDFLIANGLKPHHKVLDVGCGSLRAGVPLVDYLDPNNYYGTDLIKGLLDVGYGVELKKAGLQHKLRRGNLRQVDRLGVPFRVEFDYAIAQSLWSHLPLNHIKLSLSNVRASMRPGGVYFATIFVMPGGRGLMATKGKDGKFKYESDPYHYPLEDMYYAASSTGWDFEFIGEWGHPRGQRMCKFTKPHAAPGVTPNIGSPVQQAAPADQLPSSLRKVKSKVGSIVRSLQG